jgi:hypothetical protein
LEREKKMSRYFLFSTLWLLLLGLPVTAEQVLTRGEVTRSYQLVLEGGTPYIVVGLVNHGKRNVLIEIPAGVPLLGEREPCLPVLVGRPVNQHLAPGARASVKVEALSLSLYPHHPGPYRLPPAPAYEDEYVRAGLAVNRIWQRASARDLQSNPVKLSQLAAYLIGEQVPNAEAEVRSRATETEWKELQDFIAGTVDANDSVVNTPVAARGYQIKDGKATAGTMHQPNSRGNVFHGGAWVSARGASEWLQYDFGATHLVNEVRIHSLWTDITTQGAHLVVKLRDADGRWHTVLDLRDTNINRTQMSNGGSARSVGPQVTSVTPVWANALRVEFAGNGWFGAEDIQIWASQKRARP